MTRALAIAIAALACLSPRASAQDATEPAIEEPGVDAPGIEEPMIDEPAIDDPAIEAPSMDAEGDEADAEGGDWEDDLVTGELVNPQPYRSEAPGSTPGALRPVEPAPSRAGLLPDGSLDPCATDLRSRPVGPLQVSALDGQLGMPYRACPRAEVALGGDALIVADTAHFYGNIRASGRVRASMLLDPNVEGFVSWEALRYQTVISSVSAAYLGLGYLSYGATARISEEEGRVYAITGRMVLPTTSGLDQSSQPLGLDVGITGAWQADANFRFHMWLVLLGSLGVGEGPPEPRGGVRLGGGADWRPYEWLAFVLEIASGFGYRDALDLVAAQAGVRLALGTELGLELAASLPLVGERALDSGALPLSASLMLSWHLR